ncbi:hypothetical protein [Mycobacterium tilburgii]|uniref:hypothetical protein n=1 Tax=Mycobacterium tilburgii TaxID=44467 RepID=UPI0016429AB6|nr:hypothetical protein [Mycobacterium tilburgii]
MSPDDAAKATTLMIQMVADIGGSLPPKLSAGHLGNLRNGCSGISSKTSATRS